MAWRRRIGALLAVAAVACSLACSSSQGTRGPFRAGETEFLLGPIPTHWRSIEAPGTLGSFEDPSSGSVVSIGSRCGAEAEDVPLSALTAHLFIQFTERQLESEQLVPLAGREALRTAMTAKLDGVRRWFVTYVLKKDGCVYDFWHVAPRPATQVELTTFERVVAGFRTIP